MKSITLDKVWEQKLLDGDKYILLSKNNNFKINSDIKVYIKDNKKRRLIGFSKVYKIVNTDQSDIENISLKNVRNFRSWLAYAEGYGVDTVQQFLDEIFDKVKLDECDTLNMIFIRRVQ